ncbi:Motility associated factor glycosyltransferase family protein [Sulfidibacter corallicola]|uniref:Motility associated factor glycosyltransferase family protein n=1 Tax=Sulfidibacter corallicola TaxID=2818388 RepID=A0A8A4TVU8_SULCO|nr:6-hydroxymethylpterin diphosphokinase MptE-like protein [Sulfidibacter corallicola]QTD54086.1 motility associated factor glycosyltransferase family protein [Sulfidibacter corallicola]
MPENLEARNRAFLKEYDPDLLDELAQIGGTAQHPEPARKGGLALRYRDAWVHGRYDPLKEATKLVQSPAAQLHIHVGFGLGHALIADEVSASSRVLIFEPFPDLLRTMLHHVDLARLLPQKQAILCGSEPRFKELLARLLPIQPGALKLVLLPAHRQLMPNVDAWLKRIVAEARFQKELGRRTIDRLMPLFTRAALEALPHSTRLPGVERLADRFKDVPAVIVSPGPSLARNLAALRPYRNQVLVFALARTARPLECAGIAPDFLVHMESQPFYQSIADCTNLGQTHFLLSDKAEIPFFTHSHGHTFVYGNPTNLVGTWLAQQFPERMKRHHLDSGGSVANDACSLAVAFGCNPVILIGQDLSVSDHYYTMPEFNQNFCHVAEDERMVPGYFGRPVRSLTNYHQFLLWFGDFAARIRWRDPGRLLVNATQGGAEIPHFEKRKLREVLRRYVGDAMPDLDIVEEAAAIDPEETLSHSECLALLRRTQNQVTQIEALCRQFLSFAAKLQALADEATPDALVLLQQHLPYLETYHRAYAEIQQGLPIISGFIQSELHEIEEMDPTKVAEEADDLTRLLVEIRNDLSRMAATYGAVLSGCEAVAPILAKLTDKS